MRRLVNLYICDLCGAERAPKDLEAPTEVPHGWMEIGDGEAHLCPKCALSVYLALRGQTDQAPKEEQS